MTLRRADDRHQRILPVLLASSDACAGTSARHDLGLRSAPAAGHPVSSISGPAGGPAASPRLEPATKGATGSGRAYGETGPPALCPREAAEARPGALLVEPQAASPWARSVILPLLMPTRRPRILSGIADRLASGSASLARCAFWRTPCQPDVSSAGSASCHLAVGRPGTQMVRAETLPPR